MLHCLIGGGLVQCDRHMGANVEQPDRGSRDRSRDGVQGVEASWEKVYITDQSGQTGGVWYQYTGPVWPETGRNRSKSNLNLKFSVQMVRTGIPAGLTGNRSV